MEEIELRALAEKIASEYARCVTSAWSDLAGKPLTAQVQSVEVSADFGLVEDGCPGLYAEVGYGEMEGEELFLLFRLEDAETLASFMSIDESFGRSTQISQILEEGIQCSLFPFSTAVTGLLAKTGDGIRLREVRKIESCDELRERLRRRRLAMVVLGWNSDDTEGRFTFLLPEPPTGSERAIDSQGTSQSRSIPGRAPLSPGEGVTFTRHEAASKGVDLGFISDVPLFVTVELGHVTKTLADILTLGPGSIIELDKLAGEPVDVLVNGRLIAKGEVVVIDENFGVRVTEIAKSPERAQEKANE